MISTVGWRTGLSHLFQRRTFGLVWPCLCSLPQNGTHVASKGYVGETLLWNIVFLSSDFVWFILIGLHPNHLPILRKGASQRNGSCRLLVTLRFTRCVRPPIMPTFKTNFQNWLFATLVMSSRVLFGFFVPCFCSTLKGSLLTTRFFQSAQTHLRMKIYPRYFLSQFLVWICFPQSCCAVLRPHFSAIF